MNASATRDTMVRGAVMCAAWTRVAIIPPASTISTRPRGTDASAQLMNSQVNIKIYTIYFILELHTNEKKILFFFFFFWINILNFDIAMVLSLS